MRKVVLSLVVLLFLLVGCASTEPIEMNYRDYIEENYDNFFLTGKTDYTIEAKMVSTPTHAYNQLELVDYDVVDDGETVILKGTVGEEWSTKVSKVINTYTEVNGDALTVEFFTGNKDVYQPIKTKATPEANFALFVPKNIILEVQTAWGDVLYTNKSDAPHGKGDYLMCSNVDGKPDLTDVWVVNGAVMESTYDMSRQK